MAGSGNDKELNNWQTLAKAMQDEGADALELNFSCPQLLSQPDEQSVAWSAADWLEFSGILRKQRRSFVL
jgi:dihydroorotate dehydrogenase